MKLLLFTVFACIGIQCQSQDFPKTDGRINFNDVVTVDSTYTKNDLFVNAKKFFVETFNSANHVIQMEDKENGIIIGKGYYTAPWKLGGVVTYDLKIYHTIKVYVKDGRYKYEIDDFNYKFFGRTSGWQSDDEWHEGTLESFDKKNKNKMLESVYNTQTREIDVLKKYMAKKNPTDF